MQRPLCSICASLVFTGETTFVLVLIFLVIRQTNAVSACCCGMSTQSLTCGTLSCLHSGQNKKVSGRTDLRSNTRFGPCLRLFAEVTTHASKRLDRYTA